jgi:hypothetical protein
LTVSNAFCNLWRIEVSFVFAVIFAPLLAFFILYKYRQKYNELSQEAWSNRIFDDTSIAMYTVQVRNLPKNIGVLELQERMDRVLHDVFIPTDSNSSCFMKSKVLGYYDELYEKSK